MYKLLVCIVFCFFQTHDARGNRTVYGLRKEWKRRNGDWEKYWWRHPPPFLCATIWIFTAPSSCNSWSGKGTRNIEMFPLPLNIYVRQKLSSTNWVLQPSLSINSNGSRLSQLLADIKKKNWLNKQKDKYLSLFWKTNTLPATRKQTPVVLAFLISPIYLVYELMKNTAVCLGKSETL